MSGVGTKPGWDSSLGGPRARSCSWWWWSTHRAGPPWWLEVVRGVVVLGSDGSVVVGASVVGGRVSVTGGSVGAGAGSACRAPLATGATQTDSSVASAAAATATVGRRPCRLWVGMGERSFEQRSFGSARWVRRDLAPSRSALRSAGGVLQASVTPVTPSHGRTQRASRHPGTGS